MSLHHNQRLICLYDYAMCRCRPFRPMSNTPRRHSYRGKGIVIIGKGTNVLLAMVWWSARVTQWVWWKIQLKRNYYDFAGRSPNCDSIQDVVGLNRKNSMMMVTLKMVSGRRWRSGDDQKEHRERAIYVSRVDGWTKWMNRLCWLSATEVRIQLSVLACWVSQIVMTLLDKSMGLEQSLQDNQAINVLPTLLGHGSEHW